jgi:hypothetical protein
MTVQNSNSQIDRAILSSVGAQWKKVAMVIITVADAIGVDLPQGEDGFHLVAQRIETLIHDGHLLAQGNVKNWRFSEVRRPI